MMSLIVSSRRRAAVQVAVWLCFLTAAPAAADLPEPLVRLTRSSRYFGMNPYLLAASPDGNRVAVVCSQNGLTVFSGENLADGMKYETDSGRSLRGLSFSADGNGLVGLNQQGELVTWQIGKSRPKRTQKLKGLEGSPSYVSFSRDARRLVVATSNRQVGVYDTAEGRRLHGESSKRYFYRLTLVSPDGSLYAVGPYRQPLEVRRTDTNKKVCSIKIDVNSRAGAFSPDNRTLAVTGNDGRILLVDLEKGNLFRSLATPDRGVYDLAFSPDGNRLLVAGSSEPVRILDIAAERARTAPKGKSPKDLIEPAVKPVELGDVSRGSRQAAWVRNGRQVVVTLPRGLLQAFDARSGQAVFTETGHQGAVSGVAFLSGSRLVSTDVSGLAFCWTLPEGKPLEQRTLPTTVLAATASPDGRDVALAALADLYLWTPGSDAAPRRVVSPASTPQQAHLRTNIQRSFGQSSNFDAVLAWLSPRRLVVQSQATVIYDLDANKSTTHNLAGQYNYARALSADGRVSTLMGRDRRQIMLAATETGTFIGEVRTGMSSAVSVALSPNGQWLAVTYYREGLRVLDAFDGGSIWKRGPQTNRVRSLLMCPGRPLLALGYHDGALEVVDLLGGRTVMTGRAHNGPVTALGFSPDGKQLAVGGADSALAVWKVPDTPLPKVDEDDLDKLWTQLDHAQAPDRYKAEWALVGLGDRAVGFLQKQLTPAAPPDVGRIKAWIGELDSPRYLVRDQAERSLRKVGPAAEGEIRRALAADPSPEQRTRLEGILGEIRSGQLRRQVASRPARAISILERIATPAARAVLKTLAGGYEADPQTLRAQDALDRMPPVE